MYWKDIGDSSEKVKFRDDRLERKIVVKYLR